MHDKHAYRMHFLQYRDWNNKNQKYHIPNYFYWSIFLLCSLLFASRFVSDYYQNPIDERFYCGVCGRNYVRKKHVLRHIRYECVNVPPRFHCANCAKYYRQSNALLHHIRQKHGPLARDTFNSSGFTQRNFKVAPDGRVIFSCLWTTTDQLWDRFSDQHFQLISDWNLLIWNGPLNCCAELVEIDQFSENTKRDWCLEILKLYTQKENRVIYLFNCHSFQLHRQVQPQCVGRLFGYGSKICFDINKDAVLFYNIHKCFFNSINFYFSRMFVRAYFFL